jgi:hypothetical protein
MPPFARSYRCAAFLAFAVTFSLASRADAQSIEDARGLWFDADFEASRDAFTRVLESPALTAEDALDAHRYLAVLALVLDDEPGARGHADAAVALERDVAPPEGAPSSSVDLFRMARRRLGDAAATLTISSPAPLRHGVRGVVVARMANAPPGLVATLQITCGDDVAEGPVPSVSVAIVPDGAVTCSATASTHAGAALFMVHRELDVTGAPVVPEVTSGPNLDTARDARRVRRIAIVTTVLALAAAGAVTGIVIHGRNGEDVSFRGTTVVGW